MIDVLVPGRGPVAHDAAAMEQHIGMETVAMFTTTEDVAVGEEVQFVLGETPVIRWEVRSIEGARVCSWDAEDAAVAHARLGLDT